MRARSVCSTLWNAVHSCQPSPSATGSPSITHEPASRSRRWTRPIRFIRSTSTRSWMVRPGRDGSSSRSEIPGKFIVCA